MHPHGVPQQHAAGFPYFSGLNPEGPHRPYVDHLLANSPRCPACAGGGPPFRACPTCGQDLRHAGVPPEVLDWITARVLDLYPQAGLPGRPTVPAPPPVSQPVSQPASQPGGLRHPRQLKDETTTEPLPLPRSRTSWAAEPLLVFGLGVLGALVSSMMAIGGYVELSDGRPSGLLLALGASAIPLAALAGVIETIRARGSFPRARAAARGAHLKVRGYMVRSDIRDGARTS